MQGFTFSNPKPLSVRQSKSCIPDGEIIERPTLVYTRKNKSIKHQQQMLLTCAEHYSTASIAKDKLYSNTNTTTCLEKVLTMVSVMVLNTASWLLTQQAWLHFLTKKIPFKTEISHTLHTKRRVFLQSLSKPNLCTRAGWSIFSQNFDFLMKSGFLTS